MEPEPGESRLKAQSPGYRHKEPAVEETQGVKLPAQEREGFTRREA
jgi:hypothetical protein